MAGRHYNSDQRNHRGIRNHEESGRIKVHTQKVRIVQKRSRMGGHKINQDGIKPLQDKPGAITKINVPKNEKELKSFLWAKQYLYSISKVRLNKQTNCQNYWKTKRVDMNRRTYKSI